MLAGTDLDKLDTALAAARAARGVDARRVRPRRRAQGAYFTPTPLVEFVVARALGARLADPGVVWRADGSPAVRILDPCAGDGRFLATAERYLARYARQQGHAPAPQALRRHCIIGVERDADFADLASQRLGVAVHCREALLDPPKTLAGGVDVVIGNPPYVRSIHLARTDPTLWQRLQGRYAATSYGEWDLYAAFIEQCLAWTAPGGEVGLVVPSRWLTAEFAAPLRAHLAQAAAVRGIVDFGAAQIFADATTYCSVVFLSRKSCPQVAVARRTEGRWRCGSIPASSLSAAPWRLAVGARRRLLDRLSTAAPTLGQVARIVKGAGTNADPVYVLAGAVHRRGVVTGTSKAAGSTIQVESTACRPCLRGRDVRPWGQASPAVQCIVPYHRDGRLWTPAELAAMPLTAAHLRRFRARLDARESGRFAGESYYRFGRPQNMAFLGAPRAKIVIPDVARHGRALVDRQGAMVLDSAYAVRPADGAAAQGYRLPLLAAVLNAPIVHLWLRETGVLLRGSYVRLKTAYLASLPLPPLTPATARVEALVASVQRGHESADTAVMRAIDDALRCAYGIAEADWWGQRD